MNKNLTDMTSAISDARDENLYISLIIVQI